MRKKIAIIGSGISGLSAAWYLAKNMHEVTVFEKDNYLGGLIRTDTQDGFFFEKGPRSFNTLRSQDLLALIDELNLTSNIIYSSDNSKNRYLYLDNKLQKIPTSLFEFLFSKLTRKHIIALLKEPFRPKKTAEDETIYDFITRRFSKDIALKFFDPITTGIYGGDIKDLSIRSCFFSLYELEKKHGSLMKGMLFQKNKKNQSQLFTLKDGLSQIVDKISSLKNINFFLSTPVQKITEKRNCVQIYANHKIFEYDSVIIATPHYTIKSFFDKLPFDVEEIEYNSLTTINLGFKDPLFKLNGFGYLVPRISNEKLLGAVFDSCIFKGQSDKDQKRMTLMVDGNFKKNNLKIFVKDILKRHLNITQFPDLVLFHEYSHAIPQYKVGHYKKISNLKNNFESQFSKIFFTGSYFENVSVSGCINKSKETVFKVENKFKL